MLDPESPPRSPAIAAALGPVRAAVRASLGSPSVGPTRLLLGCSGGPDSMAALGLLTLLRRAEGLELVVGHVDHGLRPESAGEGDLVAEVAASLGLSCQRARLQLAPGAGLPARARAARRAALDERRQACGARAIVLAHTATDQAETMIMHMTRGAGLDGLAAMHPFEDPWLRPLLELTRAQTRALCGDLELPFVDDPSNADTDALRIWLRERLLPRLRQDNPRLEHALLGLARQAGDAELALDGWAQTEVERRARRAHEPSWDLDGFATLPRAVRTRVLRRMCARAGVDLTQLRRRVLDEMEAAALAVAEARLGPPASPRPPPRGWDLHPGRRVEIDKNGVHARARAVGDKLSNH